MQYVAKILFCVLKNEVDCKKYLQNQGSSCFVMLHQEVR